MKDDPHVQGLERARLLLVWLVPIGLAGAVAFAPQVLNDGDTFWHVAAGRWMLDHHAIPSADPFSFTFRGRPWVAHEWLSEVLLAGAFAAAGWAGVMLLTAVSAGALAAIMAAWLIRWLPPLSTAAALALGFACIAPGLLARPHLIVLPLAALWTAALLEARARGGAPALALALLMAIWANMHSSFILGLAIAGAFALEALLDVSRWRRRALVGWGAFLAASALLCLATPNGLAGLAFPLKVMGMKTLPAITEWQGPDFLKPSPLELALLAGAFVAFWRGVRLTAVRALVLIGLVHMTLQHVRQEALLGALGPLVLAEPLGRALAAPALPADFPWRLPRAEWLLAGLLAVVVAGARLAIPQPRQDGPTAPVTALAQVPPSLRARPLLNDYDFGGYLIFEGARPFIDGRADMYGDDFVAADARLQDGDRAALAQALARWRPQWAIVRPERPLAAALAGTPGWRRVYADRYAVVLVNDAVTPSPQPRARAPTSSAHG